MKRARDVELQYIRDCKFRNSDDACRFCIPVLIAVILHNRSQNKIMM